MSLALDHSGYRRDPGYGLVLRWSQASDFEPLSQLYRLVFCDNPNDPPIQPIMAWLIDLMRGNHTLISTCDFALVEDMRCGMIVAVPRMHEPTPPAMGLRAVDLKESLIGCKDGSP